MFAEENVFVCQIVIITSKTELFDLLNLEKLLFQTFFFFLPQKTCIEVR